jgi:hypothetical protein
MRRLILASESPHRQQLLTEAGFGVDAVPSGIDEPDPVRFGDLDEYLMHVAQRKARTVAGRGAQGLILAADTVGWHDTVCGCSDATLVAEVFDRSRDPVSDVDRLKRQRNFAYIRRQISPDEAKRVANLLRIDVKCVDETISDKTSTVERGVDDGIMIGLRLAALISVIANAGAGAYPDDAWPHIFKAFEQHPDKPKKWVIRFGLDQYKNTTGFDKSKYIENYQKKFSQALKTRRER